MKQEGSEYRSRLDISTVRQVIRGALSGKVTLSPIEYELRHACNAVRDQAG